MTTWKRGRGRRRPCNASAPVLESRRPGVGEACRPIEPGPCHGRARHGPNMSLWRGRTWPQTPRPRHPVMPDAVAAISAGTCPLLRSLYHFRRIHVRTEQVIDDLRDVRMLALGDLGDEFSDIVIQIHRKIQFRVRPEKLAALAFGEIVFFFPLSTPSTAASPAWSPFGSRRSGFARGSRNTVAACSKPTPCFLRFSWALPGSHSKSYCTSVLHYQSRADHTRLNAAGQFVPASDSLRRRVGMVESAQAKGAMR